MFEITLCVRTNTKSCRGMPVFQPPSLELDPRVGVTSARLFALYKEAPTSNPLLFRLSAPAYPRVPREKGKCSKLLFVFVKTRDLAGMPLRAWNPSRDNAEVLAKDDTDVADTSAAAPVARGS